MAGYLSIKKVAVIGSGISGVAAAAHLLAEGLDVTVFERNKAAGGVWLYDERPPIEPLYPSTKPSQGEVPGNNDERATDGHALKHAPPGPCYAGLRNNVSTPLLRTTLNAWPEGTPDYVDHHVIKEYIQDTSKKTGVHNVTKWGARVIDLQKEGESWKVTWSVLHEDSGKTGIEEVLSEFFDAVVVASGHYHAPRVPDLPGLSSLKTKWPTRVLHSKSYRRPDAYAGKNILLIGGGVSSTDIARELGPFAQNIYQSTRNGPFDLAASALPANGFRVNEISSFEITENETPDELPGDKPLPVTVHLKSTDQTIHDIHQIFICTGYHITLPFLARFHEDETLSDNASDTVLVTDGNQVHNLHKDIFYIPDPTLAFIGVPYYTATFTLFEFQAIVLAAVFSGIVKLPSRASMRSEYEERLRIKGSGRGFHSLKDSEEIYVKDILDWVNSGRDSKGLPRVQGHTDTWIAAKAVQKERLKELYGTA